MGDVAIISLTKLQISANPLILFIKINFIHKKLTSIIHHFMIKWTLSTDRNVEVLDDQDYGGFDL